MTTPETRRESAAARVDYDGPDESVECTYPGCTNRLRRSDHDEPQFCSKEHRDGRSAARCGYRSSIVLDFTERVTFRRCPVHGETEHVYQPPRPLTLRRRWQGDGRWKRRAWRTFYGFLFVSSLLNAVAHYPNLSFHGFLGALPWPMYLGFAAGWAFLWGEAGRGH